MTLRIPIVNVVIVPLWASPLTTYQVAAKVDCLFYDLPTYLRKRDWGGAGDPSEAVRAMNSIHRILKYWSVDVATYQVADYDDDDDDADC